MQVLTVNTSSVESLAHSQKALDLARLANDELAELVFRHPDRFAAAVACLPISNMDDTLRETDRAINDLRFRGVQVSTPTNGKSLDSPEFFPLYEKMSRHNLPIWIHPARPAAFADYKSENNSMHNIYSIFGWPYETTVAMVRLAYSGIFDKYPNLKFITHHGGGMVPYFAERIAGIYDLEEMRRKEDFKRKLTRAPLDYLKMFYSDTAIYGNATALMCAQAFFGSERLLFGTDFPYDNQLGERYTRETINAIQQMSILETDKKKIFVDNARKLLRLPI